MYALYDSAFQGNSSCICLVPDPYNQFCQILYVNCPSKACFFLFWWYSGSVSATKLTCFSFQMLFFWGFLYLSSGQTRGSHTVNDSVWQKIHWLHFLLWFCPNDIFILPLLYSDTLFVSFDFDVYCFTKTVL